MHDPPVDEAITKFGSTFFGIFNSGLHPDGLIPLTLVVIYQTVVLPKALYGCELWNYIQSSTMLRLERAHRECKSYPGIHRQLSPLGHLECSLLSLKLKSVNWYSLGNYVDFLLTKSRNNYLFTDLQRSWTVINTCFDIFLIYIN